MKIHMVLTFMILACPAALAAQHLEHKKIASNSRRWQLVKYFGSGAAATYGFLYLTARASQEPHAPKKLLVYSLGLPSLLGLGIYLGVLTKTKPFDALIT